MQSPKARLTIAHMMAFNFIVAIALAPIVWVLRSPRLELIVATVAYELIALPVIVILIVLAVVKPSPTRTTLITLLPLTPVFVAIAVCVATWLWTTFVSGPIRLSAFSSIVFLTLILNVGMAWMKRTRPKGVLYTEQQAGSQRPS